MANRTVYKSPNQEAVERYENEIAYWEKQYEIANEKHDWSARNWAGCQLYIKKANLESLKQKIGNKKKSNYG